MAWAAYACTTWEGRLPFYFQTPSILLLKLTHNSTVLLPHETRTRMADSPSWAGWRQGRLAFCCCLERKDFLYSLVKRTGRRDRTWKILHYFPRDFMFSQIPGRLYAYSQDRNMPPPPQGSATALPMAFTLPWKDLL